MADTVGILAYGSLIGDPGPEIEPHIIRRISCRTPFNVEFARASRTRTGGPSLVPYDDGSQVAAQILVVDLPLKEATDRLYRRETRKVGTDICYVPPGNNHAEHGGHRKPATLSRASKPCSTQG